MQRCYIEPEKWADNRLPLDPKEAHHLRHVLRLAEGAPILAFDGQGHEAETVLRQNLDGQPCLQVIQIRDKLSARQAPQWILVPAIIKGSRMDSLIEKATELGATRIIPIQTARSVVRLDPRQAVAKVERWERIAISAAKQCGTPTLPGIAPVTDLAGALRTLQSEDIPILLGSLEGAPPPIARVAREWMARQPKGIAILTGPEGDFTPAEYQQATTAGCAPVNLGKLTLRAETATIYALSVLQALYGEMQTEDHANQTTD
ncbi:MAG: RsmE family RNA methyltransferase, partial [Kiritimatiellia bacterium]